jgi:hypothetical protein
MDGAVTKSDAAIKAERIAARHNERFINFFLLVRELNRALQLGQAHRTLQRKVQAANRISGLNSDRSCRAS